MFDFSTVVRSIRRRPRPDTSLLLRVATLAHADPRRLAELSPHTDRLRLPPGRSVVRAGATARELIVVLAGEAVVLHADGTWAVLGPGAEIGGRELLGHERHAATVVATSALDVVVVNGPAARWAYAEGIARVVPPASPSPQAESRPAFRLAS